MSKLVRTRRSLHRVAEHLLAADLHRHTGRIGLRPCPGGFGTPRYVADGRARRLSVDGAELVLDDDGTVIRTPLRTLGEAAAVTGTSLGGPSGVYPLQTSDDPDEPLDVDEDAATAIARFFGVVADALAVFRAQHAHEEPSEPQLWPEHFDLATSVAMLDVGGSPGDADHDEPYLYVACAPVPREPFWNEAWGARLDWHDDLSPEQIASFYEDGRRRYLTAVLPAPPRDGAG